MHLKVVRAHTLVNMHELGGFDSVIALIIFRRSIFSRIAALKEFIEEISRMRVAHVCDSAVAQIIL